MTDPGEAGVHGWVDHLFRRESGRMVASLTRAFGPARLDLAEEVVQEALLQALRRWPFHGVPDNPSAWLFRVARNLALDRLRRSSRFRDKLPEIERSLGHAAREPETMRLSGEMNDDQIRMIFLCCHPELPRDARVALTLKIVGGFGVGEIARGFLSRPSTIAQRLVRAQRRIRELGLPFEVPTAEHLPERLEAVLEVVYLMFNEGYAAHDGDALIREDVCHEALRLVEELADGSATDGPAVRALAALLCFQASRLPARVDDDGNVVPLADQDRSRWNRPLIRRGFDHLGRAATGDRMSAYHVQAAIAAEHASAERDRDTDWPEILRLYDRLIALNPSPVIELNRAVALARVEGPQAGLAALEAIETHPAMRDYYLLPATRGELLRQCGDQQAAAASLRRALGCPCSEPERQLLQRRLESLVSDRGD